MLAFSNFILLLSCVLTIALQGPSLWNENLFTLLQYSIWPFGHYITIALLAITVLLYLSHHPWHESFAIFCHFLLAYMASVTFLFCSFNPILGINLMANFIFILFASIHYLIGFILYFRKKDRSNIIFILSFYRIIQSSYWLIVSYPLAKSLMDKGLDLRLNYTLQSFILILLVASFVLLYLRIKKLATLTSYVGHLFGAFVLLVDMLALQKYLAFAKVKTSWIEIEITIIAIAVVLSIALVLYYINQFNYILQKRRGLRPR